MRRLLVIAAALALLIGFALRWPEAGAPASAAGAKNFGARATAGGGATGAKNFSAAARATAAAPPASPGRVVAHGAWGGAPDQFGRRRDPESNPEAPMAIAAGAPGEFAIVDQINHRVSRYRDGRLAATLALGGDTVQDLALGAGGRTLLVDRLADGNVQVYDARGQLENELPLGGPGGAVTGLFADADGIYVERAHDRLFRIAFADGRADPDRPQLLGRPTRDGQLLVAAALAGRGASVATVRAFDRASGQPAWSQAVAFSAPVWQLVMLDSDAHGRVYLAADIGSESPEPPFTISGEAIVVARLDSNGAPRGTLTLPPFPTADETFRPLSVDDDGAVYMMSAGESGLDVVRYEFP